MKQKKILIPIFIFLALVSTFVLGFVLTREKTISSLKSNIDESSINWSTYEQKSLVLSESTKITTPGIYHLSGTIEDGLIEVETTGNIKLILDNVSIKNSNGPAIIISEANLVVIELAEGSTNIFSDSSNYNGFDEDICGAIFSKDDLIFEGSGKLVLIGNFEDGIVSKDDLKIASGEYEITSKDEGIRGRDSVQISGGIISINSGGDGIKSNNSEEVGKGTILIEGGEITISAQDDGVHAESILEINGGTINISESKEGLEGGNVLINGGEIDVVASDDGINAAGGNDASSKNSGTYNKIASFEHYITINGGKIHINSLGDGIDSNGKIEINGGEIIVDGPTNSGNGALDSDTGLLYNGGSIIAIGASGMATAPSTDSEKCSISAFFDKTYPAGTVIEVKNENGTTLLSHVSQKTFSHAVFSSELFEEGKEYLIFLNDSEYISVKLSGKTTRSGAGVQEIGPGDLKFQEKR